MPRPGIGCVRLREHDEVYFWLVLQATPASAKQGQDGNRSKVMNAERGDLANQAPRTDVAVVVFLDPADAPFLNDWVEESQDGRWGLFEHFVMLDTSIPSNQWRRVLKPKWWQPGPAALIRQQLANGPNLAHAQRMVGLFPSLAKHPEVIFACTYGKSRSKIAAEAFEAWLKKNPMTLPATLRERNPWWAHLLEEATNRTAAIKRPPVNQASLISANRSIR